MPNIKISELPRSNGVNANTHSTIFYAVDLQSQTSIAITANTLANTLFSNNILYANANILLFEKRVLAKVLAVIAMLVCDCKSTA